MDARHLVVGAFGYTGQYIAKLLLKRGHEVRTLTNSVHREHALEGEVRVFPLDFDNREVLLEALDGVSVLYNTYWVRFSKAGFSQSQAVRNTEALFGAAKAAGVGRIVHVSITNPSEDSPYEYFRGKAVLERSLEELGVPHSILRPAVIYGPEDVLVNNIAWMLRRFPLLGVFGNGAYRLQPIHVEDFAALAVDEGLERGDRLINAIGPETFSYRDLVFCLADAIGVRRRIMKMPVFLGVVASFLIGLVVRDIVITRQEIGALMDGLLATEAEPVGKILLSEWAREHRDSLGRRYTSELARRRDRKTAYARA